MIKHYFLEIMLNANMVGVYGAICLALLLGVARANPIDENDRMVEEFEASDDATILSDPKIGQKGAYGRTCRTPCTNHGHRYHWCWTTTPRKWDYCSPNDGDITAYGRKCRYTSKCGHGKGKRYTWCWTTTAKWDYCVVKEKGTIGDEKVPEIADNREE